MREIEAENRETSRQTGALGRESEGGERDGGESEMNYHGEESRDWETRSLSIKRVERER